VATDIIVADYGFTHPSIAQLKAAGIQAVGRYMGQDVTKDGKNLTAAEAKLLTAAGIGIFTIFEYGAAQVLKGATQAAKDVALAREQRHETGMPFDRPFYYAADFDITDYAPNSTDPLRKLGPAGEYWAYMKAHQGIAHSGGYGGYWLVSRLFDAGLIRWGFQTVAWSGGQWDERACLRQGGKTALGGVVDLDTPERADFGQWTLAPPPSPQVERTGYLVPVDPPGVPFKLLSADGKNWS
jgi:hypothetical protein